MDWVMLLLTVALCAATYGLYRLAAVLGDRP